MKRAFSLIILLLLVTPTEVFSQQKNRSAQIPFKVVGYYFLQSALRDTIYADSNYLFLNKITHLNIAFINPDSSGNFRQDLAIDTLIQKAHNKNVKVLASIAGGGPHPYYAVLLQDDKREMFINNLLSMVGRYNLDGIDVDLEGSDIDNNYGDFVIQLAASLKRNKKLITAAIATAYKDQLPDKALKQFDFVNIMSYDNTGPWSPGQPGNHSPYTMAVADLHYWHNTRIIPKVKLVLGLPFYGYGFGALDSPVVSMDYKRVVSLYPNDESDTVLLPGNTILYYNNIGTLKRKTALALKEAGGIMIWQLLGDTSGENSLLNSLYRVIHQNAGNDTNKGF